MSGAIIISDDLASSERLLNDQLATTDKNSCKYDSQEIIGSGMNKLFSHAE